MEDESYVNALRDLKLCTVDSDWTARVSESLKQLVDCCAEAAADSKKQKKFSVVANTLAALSDSIKDQEMSETKARLIEASQLVSNLVKPDEGEGTSYKAVKGRGKGRRKR